MATTEVDVTIEDDATMVDDGTMVDGTMVDEGRMVDETMMHDGTMVWLVVVFLLVTSVGVGDVGCWQWKRALLQQAAAKMWPLKMGQP